MRRPLLLALSAAFALVSPGAAEPEARVQLSLSLTRLTPEAAAALDRQVSQTAERPIANRRLRPQLRLRHRPLPPARTAPPAAPTAPVAAPPARIPDPTAERPRQVVDRPRLAPPPRATPPRPRLAPAPPPAPVASPTVNRPAKDLSGPLLDDARRVLSGQPPPGPVKPLDRAGLPRSRPPRGQGRLFGEPGHRRLKGKRPRRRRPGGHHGGPHPERLEGHPFKKPGAPSDPSGGPPPKPPR